MAFTEIKINLFPIPIAFRRDHTPHHHRRQHWIYTFPKMSTTTKRHTHISTREIPCQTPDGHHCHKSTCSRKKPSAEKQFCNSNNILAESEERVLPPSPPIMYIYFSKAYWCEWCPQTLYSPNRLFRHGLLLHTYFAPKHRQFKKRRQRGHGNRRIVENLLATSNREYI